MYRTDVDSVREALRSFGYQSDDKTVDQMRSAMIAINEGDPNRLIDGIEAHYCVAALNEYHD